MASPSPSRQVVTITMLAQMCALLHNSLTCILLAGTRCGSFSLL